MTGGSEPDDEIREAAGPTRAEPERVVPRDKALALPDGYVNAVQAFAVRMQLVFSEYERRAEVARDVFADMRAVLAEYERTAEAARATLAELVEQVDFSALRLADTMGPARVELTVRPVRVAATASRPLLSVPAVPATAEPDKMGTTELRDLLNRLWAAFYAAGSNPVVQFMVGTLINLVALAFVIAAYNVAVAAYEQDRDNNAIEQQRDATAPPITVQPAPVTVIPERGIDRRVDERMRELGVDAEPDR